MRKEWTERWPCTGRHSRERTEEDTSCAVAAEDEDYNDMRACWDYTGQTEGCGNGIAMPSVIMSKFLEISSLGSRHTASAYYIIAQHQSALTAIQRHQRLSK